MPSLTRINTFNLTTEGSDTFADAGNRVQLVGVSNASARVHVSVRHESNRATSGPFSLQLGDYVQFPDGFNQVTVEWDAQTGVSVELAVIDTTPEPLNFEYYINPRGTIDSIANPVGIKMGESQDTFAVTVGTTATLAVAANPNRIGTKIASNAVSANVFAGRTATVTTASGDPIPPGGVIFIPGTQDVHVIASAAGANIRVTEIVR